MTILFISSDPAIMNEHSAVRRRLRSYADVCGGAYCLAFVPRPEPSFVDGALTVVPIKKGGFVLSVIRALRAMVSLPRIDVISAQNPAGLGLLGYILSRARNIPLHLQIHTDIAAPSYRNTFRGWAEWMIAKRLIPRATGIRVVSRRIIESLREEGVVLPHASVLPVFWQYPHSAPGGARALPEPFTTFRESHAFMILMLSRLEREKRIDQAIEVLARLRASGVDAGLCIAGEGSERDALLRMARRCGMDAHVFFFGQAEHPFQLYDKADLLLVNSSYEGYGMTIAEALSAGCPVVSTDVGIAREAIQDGLNGYVVPVDDTEALYGILKDRVLSRERIQALRTYAVAHPYAAPYEDDEAYALMIVDDIMRTRG